MRLKALSLKISLKNIGGTRVYHQKYISTLLFDIDQIPFRALLR